MTVLATVRKGKPRGIVEAARGSVDHFGNQGKRLKRTWTEFLQKQKLSKVMKVTFVCNGEHGA